MANQYFKFKQFTIFQDKCAMKVTTDGCLFGAWCAEELKGTKKGVTSVLDIGTGTGLLSLLIAQKNKVEIDAVEIDKEAAEQAADNIKTALFPHQISVVNANILDFEKEGYDVIISNPPFYEGDLQSPSSKKNSAHHNGNLVWTDLLEIIAKKLSPDGTFYLLLPYKRWEEAKALMAQRKLFLNNVVFVAQTSAHAPFRVLVSGSKRSSGTEESNLVICNEEKQYTPPFLRLLKDYYLSL